MGFQAMAKYHDWKPGEKSKFSTSNDIKSIERSLRVLRNRNPRVGRVRARLIRWLGGSIGNPSEMREIKRLEGLLNERRARLHELRGVFG